MGLDAERQYLARGHFKTYTPDAPLLGRHVGTYWWEPQVRGRKELGSVVKDYALQEAQDPHQGAQGAPGGAVEATPAGQPPPAAGTST
jgi:hypothetical protein